MEVFAKSRINPCDTSLSSCKLARKIYSHFFADIASFRSYYLPKKHSCLEENLWNTKHLMFERNDVIYLLKSRQLKREFSLAIEVFYTT